MKKDSVFWELHYLSTARCTILPTFSCFHTTSGAIYNQVLLFIRLLAHWQQM